MTNFQTFLLAMAAVPGAVVFLKWVHLIVIAIVRDIEDGTGLV